MVDESEYEFRNLVNLCGWVAEVPVGRVIKNGQREYVGCIACLNESDAPIEVPRLTWDWFRFVLYGRLGDLASEMMEPCILVDIVGRLTTRGMQVGQHGDHSSLVVEVTNFRLLEEPSGRRFNSELGPLRN